VLNGGELSDRKGVNVPQAVLDLSPLTEKDRRDLAFGLELGVDWVALSFVQRPEDIVEARQLIGDRAYLMAKIEKPSAVEQLQAIAELADAIMVPVATWAWKCRPKACRRSRSASSAPAASWASQSLLPPRCSNRCVSRQPRPVPKSPTWPTPWPKAPMR
jgi:pyruvate kinase (EC 2.7.1.40)